MIGMAPFRDGLTRGPRSRRGGCPEEATDNEIKNHWNTHIRKKLLRMGIDPVTTLPLQKAPAPPVQQEQEKHERKAEPPQPQDQQQQQKEDELTQEAAVEEEQDPPLIQPQEIPAPPPPATSTCGSASSAGSASVVSPSYSSSSASGVEATEWPEPMYLFGMDGIMDAGWGGLFPGDGGVEPRPVRPVPRRRLRSSRRRLDVTAPADPDNAHSSRRLRTP
ncbi:hypothetical protein PR202_gb17287 [Eleusine coracana subsp. coracana]|uniref:Uncharacterized protein n=1 Tax=Eleusine coracana subsp. coracana TaxID=191504 RepID=A0AAV5F083_ELECO|nr:hypothetical protein PR202_gb17287 [Eleusine coracana subsp. coracana]